MGRRRTIDRDQLLDAAEAVISREGAAGLTIDAVAKEMGITKGGVQYCFGTKDALIDAIFERWGKRLRQPVRSGGREAADATDAGSRTCRGDPAFGRAVQQQGGGADGGADPDA